MRVNRQDFLNIKTLIESRTITEKKFKNHEIVSRLKENGSVTGRRKGTIKYIDLVKEENIFLLLQNYGFNISSVEEIESYIEDIFDNKASRDRIQSYHNNTKERSSKSMHGLYLSSLEKITLLLNGEQIEILPHDGLGYFFFHTEKIELSADTIVVGVENYQVVWFAKRYAKFFSRPNTLLVVTTPYMLEWVSHLENEYIHFGDYDLAGVNIYLNKVLPRLSRSKSHSLFIPDNIERLIEQHGNSELYKKQKQYKDLLSEDSDINRLVEIIHRYKKGLEQEGLSLLS